MGEVTINSINWGISDKEFIHNIQISQVISLKFHFHHITPMTAYNIIEKLIINL